MNEAVNGTADTGRYRLFFVCMVEFKRNDARKGRLKTKFVDLNAAK